MKKSRQSEEKIIAAVKQIEGGRKTADVARELGVSQATLYGWKSKYGGMQVSDAKRLRQLEDENLRLKHLVADLTLDKEAMKAVIAKNGWSS
jgi:putative transposase